MRWWGFLGLVMIVLAELSLFLNFVPIESYYFAIAWIGFIFLIDSFVEIISKKSLIQNNLQKFFLLFVLSAIFWWIFEFLNLGITNWDYTSGRMPMSLAQIVWRTLCFSTVLPAIFEVAELFKVLHRFDKYKLAHKHKITKKLLYFMMIIGLITLILPLAFPKYFYPLIWACFYFLLDPINYMHNEPSLIGYLEKRKLGIIFSLAAAALVCGILWEYWNYWAPIKWTYSVPFVGFLKIFEMPILGYTGYIPFAFELYTMYHFVKYYIKKIDKENKLKPILHHHK